MVTSTHWFATAVGMGILERGGNAFDAGCATAFTLQVVEPHLNGPGGDVPVILYDVRRGEPEVICGQGPVPAGATIKHFRDELGLDLVPGTVLFAACIPGTFDTWMTLLRDYGTMRLADVLLPQSATPETAIRWSSASAPPSTPSRTCSASTGRRRPRSIFREAKCRIPAPVHQSEDGRHLRAHPAQGEPTAETARPRSSAHARSGARASSPKRSTSSAAPRR